MHARFLKKGEEKQWFDLMGEESTERFTDATDYRFESHIIVEENDRVVGGLYLFIEEPDSVMLFNPKLKIAGALNPLLRKVIETAKSLKVNKVHALIHGSNDQFQTIRRVLMDSGFVYAKKKILYEFTSAKLFETDANAVLTFKPLNPDSELCFVNVFKSTYQADIFEDDAERYFRGLRKSAMETKRFYPEDWQIGYYGTKPIGITMPQLHDEGGEIGSNYYLGVIPEERKKGFGRALQRRAVEILQERGAKMIVGSTDEKNTAMIKVFESLGYEFREHQFFYTYTGPL